EVGRPAPGLQSSLSRGRFEGPGSRRPDGDPPGPAFARPLEALNRVGADVAPLRVHVMLVEPISYDRAKSTDADMQSDICVINSALRASGQQLLRKMQPRSGSRDRTAIPGINGLVAVEVFGQGKITADVGGQRDSSELVERRPRIHCAHRARLP